MTNMVDTLTAARPIPAFSIQNDRSQLADGIFHSFETYFHAFGLYARQKKRQRNLGCMLHNVYCAFTIVLLWFDMTRYFTIFSGFTDIYDRKIAAMSVAAFHITICLNSSTNFYALRKYFAGFLKECDNYVTDYRLDINKKKFKCCVKGLLSIFSCMLILGGLLLSLYLVLFQKEKDLLLLHHYTPFQTFSDEVFYPMIFVLNLTNNYGVAHQFGTVFFYCSVCFIVGFEYRRVLRKLEAMIENGNTSEIIAGFDGLRRQHEMISKVLDSSSHILHHTVFFIYASGIPIVCFVIYGLVNGGLSPTDTVSLTQYLILVVLGMLTVTGGGALVNSLAHAPISCLHRIDLDGLPAKTLQQINIFAVRLSGPPIGIDVYGLFVVDKSTVLMLFGTILTYAVIVLQIPSTINGGNTTEFECNCTTT